MRSVQSNLAAGLFSLLALLLPWQVVAEASDINPEMTRLLQSRLNNVPVETPVATPVEGIYQTRFGSKFAYITGDGRYVLIGDMIDLQSQVNLTELSRREIALDAINEFPVKDLVVFPAEGETKRVLNVFTDSSCPYCRKLHEEVPYLQKAGIEVRYFPFPRGGQRGPGYQELRQVWCGKDRPKSMDIVKGVDSGDLANAECSDGAIVDRGYNLGNEVGVSGTPALFTSTGRKLDGYVPYQQLIPMLLSDS